MVEGPLCVSSPSIRLGLPEAGAEAPASEKSSYETRFVGRSLAGGVRVPTACGRVPTDCGRRPSTLPENGHELTEESSLKHRRVATFIPRRVVTFILEDKKYDTQQRGSRSVTSNLAERLKRARGFFPSVLRTLCWSIDPLRSAPNLSNPRVPRRRHRGRRSTSPRRTEASTAASSRPEWRHRL